MRLTWAFLFVLEISASTAFASYVTAELGHSSAPKNAAVHVVIAGQGLEAGDEWLVAAHTQALVYKDRDPEAPIELIAAVDPAHKAAYLSLLTQWGYQDVQYSEDDFVGDGVVTMLAALPEIASLDYAGHDGAFLGLALQDEASNHRFYRVNVDHMVGRVRFSPDSYIRLMGCNTGWFLAPYLAQKIGVPSAGTLTSADVQILTNDGQWNNDEKKGWPAGLKAVGTNAVSFAKPVHCLVSGGCLRLKAINGSYYGQHGVYAGGQPFLKFFCGAVPQDDCFRRMALSTKYLIGLNPMAGMPTIAAFAETLADQFCPTEVDPLRRKACQSAITRHVTGEQALAPSFNTMGGHTPPLSCSFAICQFKVAKDDHGQSVLVSTGPAVSTTFVDELNAYRQGFANWAR